MSFAFFNLQLSWIYAQALFKIMLRPSRIRSPVYRPFVCWKCSAKLHSGYGNRGQLNRLTRRPLLRLENCTTDQLSFAKKRSRCFNTGSIGYASTDLLSNRIPSPEPPPPDRPPTRPNIRQHLREWELEYAHSYALPPASAETAKLGDIRNSLTRPNEGDFQIELDIDDVDNDESLIIYDREELLDAGNIRGFLLAGDLVELRAIGGQQKELAIFVREVENQSQFYTMSGRWIHRSSQSAHFFVPCFVDQRELDEIRPYLPTVGVSTSLRDKLQNFPQSVPRDMGKSLIRKMLDFWRKSDAAYQAAATRLDNAHEKFAHSHRFTYATLEQIAEKTLNDTALRTEDGKFPDHVLYAVHRSLLRDDIGFRPQIKGTLRAGGQYEISPLKEVITIKQVCANVRSHREQEAARQSGAKRLPTSLLELFAIEARRLIDLSRSSRQLTSCGTIGPLTNWREGPHPNSKELIELLHGILTCGHAKFVLFLESWAALTSFGSQSSLNGIGSEILRAIKRYEGFDLDQSTAWTFLQEIGVISPWENRLAFDLRLPGIGRRLIAEHTSPASSGPVEDKLQYIRKDWDDLPVYCIDDFGAHEIDDGISIEKTDKPEEFWIRIHAADPATHTDPESETATFAESATENVYMPDRVVSMLRMDHVQAHFSLAPGRPSMTFSARMNKNGQILDTEITPGIVREVLYFSPTVMKQVVLGPTWSEAKKTVRSVGVDFSRSLPSRPMLESHQLSDENKADLCLLNEIGEAHAAQLRAKGGVDQNFQAKPRVSVSLSNGFQRKGKEIPHFAAYYDGDPRIELSTAEAANDPKLSPVESNLVQSCMLIAAQVAAKWCSDRGIPIPYRVTPRNLDKEDPSEFFTRKVLPSRAENGVASIDITSEYLCLIGGVFTSTCPGPHAAVGVDMMARCTSPLRRFTDLLVHWQIGAALMEEARLGRSLIGNTKDDFLPFSKARIDALLPRLDTREKLIKYGQNEADRHFLCHFLVRAWKFKEAEIPSTFTFLVRNIHLEERKVFGMLTEFSAQAGLSISDELNLEEMHVGDMLEVELEDVNVYSRKIQVKALRRSETPKSI